MTLRLRRARTGVEQTAERPRDGMALWELEQFVRHAYELGVPPTTPIEATTTLRGRILALLAP